MEHLRTAFILLWFPKPTETFVFREITRLRDLGLPLTVHTLYGPWPRSVGGDRTGMGGDVERLGLRSLPRLLSGICFWAGRDPGRLRDALQTIPWRRWGTPEKTGENLWAFLCGFHLARRFVDQGISHIHAPWAGGPATAAWTASRLTGIPFSFSARAWDIYPPDGGLREKIRDAAFVRSETRTNIPYLGGFAGAGREKLHLVYNGLTLPEVDRAPVPMVPPYRFLALGRLVGKKGFDILLTACGLLQRAGLPFELTLAGSGPLEKRLKARCRRLGLEPRVHFPGFVPHDRVAELFRKADVFIMPCVIDRSGDRDGIPTVIMEALMHRVPVVAADVSGVGEVIRDGVTGHLVAPGDPAGLAKAVVRLLKGRQAALQMAERGREQVLRDFDPQACARTMLRLLTEAAASPAPTNRRDSSP